MQASWLHRPFTPSTVHRQKASVAGGSPILACGSFVCVMHGSCMISFLAFELASSPWRLCCLSLAKPVFGPTPLSWGLLITSREGAFEGQPAEEVACKGALSVKKKNQMTSWGSRGWYLWNHCPGRRPCRSCSSLLGVVHFRPPSPL